VAVVQLFQVDDSLEVLVCWYCCISAYKRLPRISILNIDDQIKVAYTMPLLLLLLLLHQLLLLTLLQLQPLQQKRGERRQFHTKTEIFVFALNFWVEFFCFWLRASFC